MKNKHPERQPQKAISSGCSFQRYFSSSLLLVIHKRLVLTPASCHSYHPVPDPASMRRSAPFARWPPTAGDCLAFGAKQVHSPETREWVAPPFCDPTPQITAHGLFPGRKCSIFSAVPSFKDFLPSHLPDRDSLAANHRLPWVSPRHTRRHETTAADTLSWCFAAVSPYHFGWLLWLRRRRWRLP